MKRKLTSLLFVLGLASLLASCGEPTTPITPEPEPAADPYEKYEGRVSRLEFTNHSFLDAPYHSNDPAYYDDSKELSTYATKEKRAQILKTGDRKSDPFSLLCIAISRALVIVNSSLAKPKELIR